MIEDFMLLANREVATYIYDLSKNKNKDLAFIYRIHDTPNPDKVEELGVFLRAIGYEFETHNGIVKSDCHQQTAERSCWQTGRKPDQNR